VGFVIRLQSNANSRYPAILIYEDYAKKYQAMITGKRPDVFLSLDLVIIEKSHIKLSV